MEFGEGRGEDMGNTGSRRPCRVVGGRLGGSSLLGMRAGWPRLHLVWALDGGGLGGNTCFPHLRFKLRDCLTSHLALWRSQGKGWRCLAGLPQSQGRPWGDGWHAPQPLLTGFCASCSPELVGAGLLNFFNRFYFLQQF